MSRHSPVSPLDGYSTAEGAYPGEATTPQPTRSRSTTDTPGKISSNLAIISLQVDSLNNRPQYGRGDMVQSTSIPNVSDSTITLLPEYGSEKNNSDTVHETENRGSTAELSRHSTADAVVSGLLKSPTDRPLSSHVVFNSTPSSSPQAGFEPYGKKHFSGGEDSYHLQRSNELRMENVEALPALHNSAGGTSASSRCSQGMNFPPLHRQGSSRTMCPARELAPPSGFEAREQYATQGVVERTPSSSAQKEGTNVEGSDPEAAFGTEVSDNDNPIAPFSSSLSVKEETAAQKPRWRRSSESSNSIRCVPLPVPLASNTTSTAHPSTLPTPCTFARRNAIFALSEDPEDHEKDLHLIQKSVEEREEVRNLLVQNSLFSILDEESIEHAVDMMEREEHPKGFLIFKQGEEPEPKLYIVLYGRCEVHRNGKHLRHVTPGGYFGEFELMYQQKSSVATVECMTDSTFYTLHQDHYQRIMLRCCLEQRSRFKHFIDSVPFFKNVSEYDRLQLSDAMSVKTYSSGEKIVSYGQVCTELLLLMEGRTRTLGRSTEGTLMEIVCQEPGDVIGELEFLFDHHWVTEVIVISSEARVARVSRHHFESIMGPVSSCVMQFVSEVPIYESYFEVHTNKKVHDEIQELRQKAQRLQNEKEAKKRESTLERENSSPQRTVLGLEYHEPHPTDLAPRHIHVGPNNVLPLGSNTGIFGDGANMNDLISSLAVGGELLMRLPPLLVLREDNSAAMLPQRELSHPPPGSPTLLSTAGHIFSGAMPNPSSNGGGAHTTNAHPYFRFPMNDLFELSSVMVIPVRGDGVILSWSHKLEQLTGYHSTDAVGQSVCAFLQSEHEQQRLLGCIKKALEGHHTLDTTAESTLRDAPCTSVTPPLTPRGKENPLASTPPGNVFHLSKEDGLSTALVEIYVKVPDVEYQIIDPNACNSHPVALLLSREKKVNPADHLMKLVSAEQLMEQARQALGSGDLSYEERLYSVAEIIENYDAVKRAQEVSKEGWQAVHLRELVGKIIMDCVNDCVDSGHSIHQQFENLSTEEALVDLTLLPRVLKHTLRIVTHYSKNADITVTLSVREHSGMEFLAFIFSCDNAHISPALEHLLHEVGNRSKRRTNAAESPIQGPFTGSGANVQGKGIVFNHQPGNSGLSFVPSDYYLGESFALNDPYGSGGGGLPGDLGYLNQRGTAVNPLPIDPAMTEISHPRFRKHIRGIRHAIEQQGGTVRTHHDDAQCHVMYLLPFIPVVESSLSPPPLDFNAAGVEQGPNPTLENSSLLQPHHTRPSTFGQVSPMSFGSPQLGLQDTPKQQQQSLEQEDGNNPPWLLFTANKNHHPEKEGPGAMASLSSTGTVSSPFQQTALEEASNRAMSFTTLVAEENTAQRNLLCKYLWQRKHAVLSAMSYAEIQHLAESVDIIIIDVFQFMLQSSNTLYFLQEKAHRLSIVVTGEMDQASSDAYLSAGFLVIPKPVRPSDFRAALDKAEAKIRAFKKDAQSIAMIRHALSDFRMTAWNKGALLGRGTHGEVYQATSIITGGVMAVKEMRVGKNSEKLEDVLSEILTMCSLQHPNIIHYFSCELSTEAAMVSIPIQKNNAPSPSPYKSESLQSPEKIGNGRTRRLAPVHKERAPTPVNRYLRVFMEFAAGGALRDYLTTVDKLEFKEYQSLLQDIVSGLAYIHANHYVHGDIKTANILLTLNKEAKIGDFGSARRVLPGELIYVMEGSITYMSPECLSAGEIGDNGRRIGFSFPTDIWSLGVVAMEMITNRAPYSHVRSAHGPAALTQYLTTLTTDTPDLSPLFDYPPCVTEFIAACLQVDPAQRKTAEELLHLSLFHESDDMEANSALKALHQAELRHILEQYVAFQEPKSAVASPKLMSGSTPALFIGRGDVDDFFDSDTTEEASGSEDASQEDADSEDGIVEKSMLIAGRHSETKPLHLRTPQQVNGTGSYPSVSSPPDLSQEGHFSPACLPPPQEYDMALLSNQETSTSSRLTSALPERKSGMGSRVEMPWGTASTPDAASRMGRRPSRLLMLGEEAATERSMRFLQREASTVRTSTSLHDSVMLGGHPPPENKLSRFYGARRISKIASIIRSVGNAVEEAADEVMSAITKTNKHGFSPVRGKALSANHASRLSCCTPAVMPPVVNNNSGGMMGSLPSSRTADPPHSPLSHKQCLTMVNLTTLQSSHSSPTTRLSTKGSSLHSFPKSEAHVDPSNCDGSVAGSHTNNNLLLPPHHPFIQPSVSSSVQQQQQQRQQFNAIRMARYHNGVAADSISSGMPAPQPPQPHVSDDGRTSYSYSHDGMMDSGSGVKTSSTIQLPQPLPGRVGSSPGGWNSSPYTGGGSSLHPSRSMVGHRQPHTPTLLTPFIDSAKSKLERSAAQLFLAHHRVFRKGKKNTDAVYVAPEPDGPMGDAVEGSPSKGLSGVSTTAAPQAGHPYDVSASPTPLTSFVSHRSSVPGHEGGVSREREGEQGVGPPGSSRTQPCTGQRLREEEEDRPSVPAGRSPSLDMDETRQQRGGRATDTGASPSLFSPLLTPQLGVLVEDIQGMLHRLRTKELLLPASSSPRAEDPTQGSTPTDIPSPGDSTEAINSERSARRLTSSSLISDSNSGEARSGAAPGKPPLRRGASTSGGNRSSPSQPMSPGSTGRHPKARAVSEGVASPRAVVHVLKDLHSVLKGMLTSSGTLSPSETEAAAEVYAADRQRDETTVREGEGDIESPSHAPNYLPIFQCNAESSPENPNDEINK